MRGGTKSLPAAVMSLQRIMMMYGCSLAFPETQVAPLNFPLLVLARKEERNGRERRRMGKLEDGKAEEGRDGERERR